MKKAFCILIVLICVFLVLAPLKTEAFSANADEQITVRFYYENHLLSVSSINSDTPFVLPDITAFADLLICANIPSPPALSGKNVRWRINSANGEIVENAVSVSVSTDFYAELIETQETVIYTFIYNYYSPNDYQKKVKTFSFGETATKPEILGSTDYPVYGDAYYTNIMPFEQVASHNVTYFAKPNKKVYFTLNGEQMSTDYGAPLSSILGTETHKYDKFYLNEEHTLEYAYTLLDGLILFADKIRFAYKLTLINENEEQILYIPINDNFITENQVGDGKWFSANGTEISFPYEIKADTVFSSYAQPNNSENSNPENNIDSDDSSISSDPHKLSDSEKTALIVVSCTLGFIVIGSLVYEKFLKERVREKLNKKFDKAYKYNWDSKHKNKKSKK